MARDGSNIYSAPAGTLATSGTTIESAKYNAFVNDLVADANLPRPIVAGGTGATTAAGILSATGVTATAAEVNVLDGITATTAELNKLAGTPAGLTSTEIGYLDGVTSAIQTQLNAKQATITTLPLANGGTGAALVDPNADRLMFWDDSAGATAYLTPGTGLTITGTTIAAGGHVVTWLAAQATTSGTAFDFTGIPATARELWVRFQEVSTSGSDYLLVQLGDAGGIEATGYDQKATMPSGSGSTASTGFAVVRNAGAQAMTGMMRLVRTSEASHIWFADHNIVGSTTWASIGGGTKTLSDTLTQVRVTRDGTDTFDLGEVQVGYR